MATTNNLCIFSHPDRRVVACDMSPSGMRALHLNCGLYIRNATLAERYAKKRRAQLNKAAPRSLPPPYLSSCIVNCNADLHWRSPAAITGEDVCSQSPAYVAGTRIDTMRQSSICRAAHFTSHFDQKFDKGRTRVLLANVD